MEPTVIREEVQAFLQTCQSFTGFALYNGLTTAEREAIATVVRTLGRDFKPSLHDQPRSYLPVVPVTSRQSGSGFCPGTTH